MFPFAVFLLALGYAALFVGWMVLLGKQRDANRYLGWVQDYHEYVILMLTTERVGQFGEPEAPPPELRLH